MTLPIPNLDTRSYDQLLEEALRRLPLYTPEYTNLNVSDPGRAILEANAYLTETLLYQINRVPDQTYVAFLDLLGVSPRPAQAARAGLSFQLKDLKAPSDPLVVDIPRGSQAAVDDPDLPQEVVFETDAALRALNADFGLALAPTGADGVWQAVTRFDSAGERSVAWPHAFHPFAQPEAVGRQFVFALVLRPKADEPRPEDRMPTGPLDLFVEAAEVFDTDPAGQVITGPAMDRAGPLAPAPDAPPPVMWEVYSGDSESFTPGGATGWQGLNVSLDETDGLRRSGHVTLEIPSGMVGVRLGQAPTGFWSALDLVQAPKDGSDLIELLSDAADPDQAEALKDAMTDGVLAAIGVPDPAGMLSECFDAQDLADALDALRDTLDPAALTQEQWAELLPAFAAPDVPSVVIEERGVKQTSWLPLYFFRVTLRSPAAMPRLLNRLRLNTVGATAATTRKDERLGLSNGRPGQTMRLSRAPVYVDPRRGQPDLVLTIEQDGMSEPWARVPDFHGAGPADKVYLLDPMTGEVRFGDGRAGGIGGAIPPQGAIIRASEYRFGGGALANVAKNTITKIKGTLPHVKAVSNPRDATGGAEAETLDQVKRRAPSTLRRRERAVSAQDFADLALETPGAAIHKAYAIAAKVPDGEGFRDAPGAVSLVVLPNRDHPTPQPTEADLAAVRGWLNPRRLITTEMHVLGPRYFVIHALTAQIKVDARADFATVADAAREVLTTWLHPIRGGVDGDGWPFGADIFHADIYDRLLAIDGVVRVQGLAIRHDAADPSPPDVVAVPEGYLPTLAPGAIGFEVGYV